MTLTATDQQVNRVRRLTDETSPTTYSDDDIKNFIISHPIPDRNGEKPFMSSLTSTPILNPIWVQTFDLYLAAADIWEEKASKLAPNYDMSADGASLSRSQAYDHAIAQIKQCRKRRKITSITLQPDYSFPPVEDASNRTYGL